MTRLEDLPPIETRPLVSNEEGYSPWFRAEVEELGGTMPEILNYNDANELDFEQVLALEPDVILAPHSGLPEVEYNRLSEIAPTVAYPLLLLFSESWQSLVEIVGDSLGQPAKADEIIAETQSKLDAVKEENPRIADTTFAYGLTLSDGATEAGIYIPSDLRVQFLTELGLQNTPAMETVLGTVEGDNWYGAVSLEELDTIPADIFVAWSNSQAELDYTLNHPTFKLWEPIATGHYLFPRVSPSRWPRTRRRPSPSRGQSTSSFPCSTRPSTATASEAQNDLPHRIRN